MTTNSRFETYTDKKGEHRWRLVAENGEIVGASSEGFSSNAEAGQNALRTYLGLKKEFEDAVALDDDGKPHPVE